MKVRAFWGPRLESYADCASKLARLIPAINNGLCDDEAWLENDGAPVDPAPEVIGRYMDQYISEVTGKPFDDRGWCAFFHRGSGVFSTLRLQCGASSWTGNSLILLFPDDLPYNFQTISQLIIEIQSIYDPNVITASSAEGLHRNAESGQPSPVVDWMVYLANTLIPAEELPMVHSVERVGSGTLVILKKEPINLEKPEDLALVEAVEPVIRRHQPDLEMKPPPRRPRQAQ